MKLHFGHLLGLSALLIAGCAAFFSVYGIGQLFAGATTAVIIMASALEFGKLVAASYLQRYWKKINILMRIYVVIGVTVLIAITSGGIYGFLSSAYQETYQKFSINQNQIKFLEQKEKFYVDDVARYEVEMERISTNIATLSNTKANSIQVRDTSSNTGFRNTISTSGLRLAQERINVEEANRRDIMLKRNVASDSLQKYQLSILNKENDSEVSAELGPLTYIANLTGISMDNVVNYFILLLIFVFDPLAITLVIATNWVFEQESIKRREEKVDKEIDGDVEVDEVEEVEVDEVDEVEVDEVEEVEVDEVKVDEVKVDEAEILDEAILAVSKNSFKADVAPTNARTILKSGFSTSEPLKMEHSSVVKSIPDENVVTETPNDIVDVNEVKPSVNQVTSIKSNGVQREEIKEIRENKKSRNFSRSIPARRGY
jgi:hypothetical protein